MYEVEHKIKYDSVYVRTVCRLVLRNAHACCRMIRVSGNCVNVIQVAHNESKVKLDATSHAW